MPPEWMWCLADELVKHFEKVKARRDDPNASDDDEDAPGMIQNELAKGMR